MNGSPVRFSARAGDDVFEQGQRSVTLRGWG